MKLLISIGSYLLKDTCWRWREQPGSVLTRFVVAYALVLPSLGLLGAFALMADHLEARLKRDGIDMLYVTEQVFPRSDDIAARQRHALYAQLAEHGTMFQLLQLFGAAKTPESSAARVVAYPDASIRHLSGVIAPESPVVFLSDALPAGMPIRAEVDKHHVEARARRPTGTLAKLFQENVLLVPEGMLPRLELNGHLRVSLLKADDVAALRGLERAVRLTAKLDERSVFTRGSTKLLDDLERLKSKQARWRFGLAVAGGGVLALVLGTLAVLEYQQRAYVIALLRGFGVRRWMVYVAQLLENAVVVNLAGVAAYFTLACGQRALYRAFGAGAMAGFSFERMLAEVVVILACVNVGVLISTLPALRALRKEVGTILS